MLDGKLIYDVCRDYSLELCVEQVAPDMRSHSAKETQAFGVSVTEIYNYFDELVYIICDKKYLLNGMTMV